ncbi:MAG: ATP-grasp domain-containing protein [Oscillospiraceae bacterium]|nr:ATP-grasp domain-containing protein [Oscillospiraceae bacterium]
MDDKITAVLFPSSYFSKTNVDEEFALEYRSAAENGMFETILFDQGKWFDEGRLSLIGGRECRALYRGWMIKPEEYSRFYEALGQQGIRLITAPEAYERFHIFPNIYGEFVGDTPKMITVPPGGSCDLAQIKAQLGRFMVKDYVKSVKGTDFPKYFSEDITEEEFGRQLEIFYKYRGSLLTGGLCFKQYVELMKYGEHTNEWRVFYLFGNILSKCPNSEGPSYAGAPPPPRGVSIKGESWNG